MISHCILLYIRESEECVSRFLGDCTMAAGVWMWLCTLLVVTLLPRTQACTCARGHIQEHFCYADFVIRARVKSDPVEIFEQFSPESSYRYPVSIKYEIEVKDIFKGQDFFHSGNEDETSISTPTTEETQDTRRGAEMKYKRSAELKYTTYRMPVEEEYEHTSQYQQQSTVTSADLTNTPTDSGEKDITTTPTVTMETNQTEATFDNNTESNNTGTVAMESSTVVMTTEAVPEVPSKTWLYTGYHSSLCGIRLRPQTSYLVMGWLMKGRMWTGLCVHTTKWTEVKYRQRIALNRNLYKRGCDCQVTSWPSEGAGCRWEPYRETGRCYEENSHCERRNGKCVWKDNSFLASCLAQHV